MRSADQDFYQVSDGVAISNDVVQDNCRHVQGEVLCGTPVSAAALSKSNVDNVLQIGVVGILELRSSGVVSTQLG